MTQATVAQDPIVKTPRRKQEVRAAAPKAQAVTDIFEQPAAKRPLLSIAAPPPPTRQRIAQIAYDIWQERGRPHGDDLSHWFSAEAMLWAQQHAHYPRPSV